MLLDSVPLSKPGILLFAALLSLVCWAFGILICRDRKDHRALSKRRQWISPVDLLITASFIVTVTGLSLLVVRLPSFLPIP